MSNTSAICAASSPNHQSSPESTPCPKRLKSTVEPDEVIDLTGPDPPQVAMHITIDDDDDDEVEIVEPPTKVTPVKSEASAKGNLKEDDDVLVTGTVNEARLPHMRPHCTKHPFVYNGNNSLSCDLCYCYVCDVPVNECKEWNASHCNACDKGPRSFHWKFQRQNKTSGDALLEARIDHGKLLKNLFLSLSRVAKTVRLECNGRTGISCNVKGDDPTYFASFGLRQEAFQMLKCTQRTFLYINVKKMNMILRNVKRQSHVVELRATMNELTVTVKEKNTGETVSHPGKLSTRLPVNGNNWSFERPSQVYNCEATMPAADLKRIVGKLDKLPHLSDPFPCCITLHKRSSSISFSTPQSEPWRGLHTLSQSGLGTSVIMATNNDSFPVEINGRLLCHIMRPTPLSKSVYLKMSPDRSRPIEIEYNLLTPARANVGRFSFFIKPVNSGDSFDMET